MIRIMFDEIMPEMFVPLLCLKKSPKVNTN